MKIKEVQKTASFAWSDASLEVNRLITMNHISDISSILCWRQVLQRYNTMPHSGLAGALEVGVSSFEQHECRDRHLCAGRHLEGPGHAPARFYSRAAAVILASAGALVLISTRFNRLKWTTPFNASIPQGLLIGGMEGGAIGIWNPTVALRSVYYFMYVFVTARQECGRESAFAPNTAGVVLTLQHSIIR
jgi:hypothetical protein